MSRFSEVGSVPPGGRKLLKFLILFENPNLLFFPGQFLSGRVLVELEDETPVLGKSYLASWHRTFFSMNEMVNTLLFLHPCTPMSSLHAKRRDKGKTFHK